MVFAQNDVAQGFFSWKTEQSLEQQRNKAPCYSDSEKDQPSPKPTKPRGYLFKCGVVSYKQSEDLAKAYIQKNCPDVFSVSNINMKTPKIEYSCRAYNPKSYQGDLGITYCGFTRTSESSIILYLDEIDKRSSGDLCDTAYHEMAHAWQCRTRGSSIRNCKKIADEVEAGFKAWNRCNSNQSCRHSGAALSLYCAEFDMEKCAFNNLVKSFCDVGQSKGFSLN